VQNYKITDFLAEIGGFGGSLFGLLVALNRGTSNILFMNSILGKLFQAPTRGQSDYLNRTQEELDAFKSSKFTYQGDCEAHKIKFRSKSEEKSYE